MEGHLSTPLAHSIEKELAETEGEEGILELIAKNEFQEEL